ncbi:MAG: 2OG-Fe(II) oxygenase [Pseudomonadota bacterium]
MQATGFDLLCSDMLQVQVYEKGGQYQDHFDFFAKEMPGFDRAIADGGQRTWTFMIYLNTVKEGGGTRFPAIDHTFTAKAGRALFWNNLNPDGTLNPLTIHAGLPVKKGKKVIATKWFREAPTWAMLQRFQGYAAG